MDEVIHSREEAFESAYKLIERLLHNPEDIELEEISRTSEETIGKIARYVDSDVPALLSSFLKSIGSISGDEYVQTFELSPKCPLYLGHHIFEEPATCAKAATSGRNMYMIELINIYKHFGLEITLKEMPDYLPVMIEFLGLSLQRQDDPIREKFVREYMMPSLPEIVNRLKELGSPYLNLIKGLYCIVQADIKLDIIGKTFL